MLSEINAFVNWVRRRNPEARTWRDYGYDLKQFSSVIGNKPFREISVKDIDSFVNQQVSRGLKPSTINRRLAAITSLYNFLSYEYQDLICPVLKQRHFIREPIHLPRPVPQAVLEKFFKEIHSARDLAMFILMLRCGLRIAEVASLTMADLFLDEDLPRLVVCGKGSRERSAYLSPLAENHLRAYLEERPITTNDYLFLSYQLDGLSTTAIHKRLMLYRNKAGVKITAHRLRHTFANDLVSADMPVVSIQKLLGHRWLESTQTYVQANDKLVKEDFFQACQKLEGWS